MCGDPNDGRGSHASGPREPRPLRKELWPRRAQAGHGSARVAWLAGRPEGVRRGGWRHSACQPGRSDRPSRGCVCVCGILTMEAGRPQVRSPRAEPGTARGRETDWAGEGPPHPATRPPQALLRAVRFTSQMLMSPGDTQSSGEPRVTCTKCLGPPRPSRVGT